MQEIPRLSRTVSKDRRLRNKTKEVKELRTPGYLTTRPKPMMYQPLLNKILEALILPHNSRRTLLIHSSLSIIIFHPTIHRDSNRLGARTRNRPKAMTRGGLRNSARDRI